MLGVGHEGCPAWLFDGEYRCRAGTKQGLLPAAKPLAEPDLVGTEALLSEDCRTKRDCKPKLDLQVNSPGRIRNDTA